MRATLVREYTHPDKMLAATQGNMQVLPNGNVFVGWGSEPSFSEFGPDGELLFDAAFPTEVESYRAFRFPWKGQPDDGPAVAAESGADDRVTIYASWNGATEVDTWQVLAGGSPDELEPVGSAPRKGFETVVTVDTSEPYVGRASQRRLGQGARHLRGGRAVRALRFDGPNPLVRYPAGLDSGQTPDTASMVRGRRRARGDRVIRHCRSVEGHLYADTLGHVALYPYLVLTPGALLVRWFWRDYFFGAALAPAAFVTSVGLFALLALPMLILQSTLDAYLWACGTIVAACWLAAVVLAFRPEQPEEGHSDFSLSDRGGMLWMPFAALVAALSYIARNTSPSYYR